MTAQNPTTLARKARALINHVEERDGATVCNARLEAGLILLGRLARIVGGRLLRQHQAQIDHALDRDPHPKPERMQAVLILLERAVDESAQYQARLASFN